MSIFLEAWIIGIAVAAPLGPMGLLCIKKTLEMGMMGAICVGLGVALGDGVYGVIAGGGFSTLSQFLVNQTVWIRAGGGGFLLYLAYREYRTEASQKTVKTKNQGKYHLMWQVFLLTLTNPMTILSFVAVFAALSQKPMGVKEMMMTVVGVFLGSLTWSMILGGFVHHLRHKLPQAWIARVKYISCLILAGFGFAALASGLWQMIR